MYQVPAISLYKALLGRCLLVFIPALSAAEVVADEQAGQGSALSYVVSHMNYALTSEEYEMSACHEGLTQGYKDRQSTGEEDPLRQANRSSEIRTACFNPAAGSADPAFKTVRSEELPVFGMDLDGGDSDTRGGGVPAAKPAQCSHKDFDGLEGTSGIDNQFYRVVGCVAGYQSTGQANLFDIEMLAGSWGILIELEGLDNPENDEGVRVGVFANVDPIRLSAERKPLPYGSYSVHPDSDFQVYTQGRVVNGMLVTEPFDIKIPYIVDALKLNRELKDARLQLRLLENGQLEGYLAGYAPLDNLYNIAVTPRSARLTSGELAPEGRRTKIGVGKAMAFGHSCDGFYYALRDHADGHRDAVTGQCTTISMQYRIKALPAFLIKTD